MCSWATAPFLFCLMALMDTVWNRFLKLNCLLLLAPLPVIQRPVNGIQQNLQSQSKQQQVKRQNGLSFCWRLLFMIVMCGSAGWQQIQAALCLWTSMPLSSAEHVSVASSDIAKDHNDDSQFLFIYLCLCKAQIPIMHYMGWGGGGRSRSYDHLKSPMHITLHTLLWPAPYVPGSSCL